MGDRRSLELVSQVSTTQSVWGDEPTEGRRDSVTPSERRPLRLMWLVPAGLGLLLWIHLLAKVAFLQTLTLAHPFALQLAIHYSPVAMPGEQNSKNAFSMPILPVSSLKSATP